MHVIGNDSGRNPVLGSRSRTTMTNLTTRNPMTNQRTRLRTPETILPLRPRTTTSQTTSPERLHPHLVRLTLLPISSARTENSLSRNDNAVLTIIFVCSVVELVTRPGTV